MNVCDLTHAYHETSGGIRTYINSKKDYILNETEGRHALVVPGPETGHLSGERWDTFTIESPGIRGAAPYRWFRSSGPAAAALIEARPASIELGTYYMPTEARAAFLARKAALKEGRGCVVSAHIHTDFPESYARTYAERAFGKTIGSVTSVLAAKYSRYILNTCDFVITLSPQFRDRVKEMGVKRVLMAPQGVDLERFGPHRVDPALREEFGVADGSPFLLYSGRFDSEKHVHVLVEAFDLLPADLGAVLVMIGEGPRRDSLADAAATRPGLHVLPYQSDKARVAALLATADVYVTAGPHEVYAFSVVEAQASGTAVVGVRAGGLITRVPEELGFLVDVGDSRAFAARIQDAYAVRDAMGAAARVYAEEQYSWKATFGLIMEETKRALERQGRSA